MFQNGKNQLFQKYIKHKWLINKVFNGYFWGFMIVQCHIQRYSTSIVMAVEIRKYEKNNPTYLPQFTAKPEYKKMYTVNVTTSRIWTQNIKNFGWFTVILNWGLAILHTNRCTNCHYSWKWHYFVFLNAICTFIPIK